MAQIAVTNPHGLKSVLVVLFGLILTAAGCAGLGKKTAVTPGAERTAAEYRIGPGDQLQIFVWRNPEVSVTIPVRPDGRISTPLVEDMVAVGKTPTQLARDLEKALAKYIRSPLVTVIVTGFVGVFREQIRVVGQATTPKALSYRDNMTLLDVMIEVGGLNENAAGNRAKLIRRSGNKETVLQVRLQDLIEGDISQNVTMRPGDIVIIPQTRF
jgi:polysaccharide export outer membrane protein